LHVGAKGVCNPSRPIRTKLWRRVALFKLNKGAEAPGDRGWGQDVHYLVPAPAGPVGASLPPNPRGEASSSPVPARTQGRHAQG
jgi:hypothetical protein